MRQFRSIKAKGLTPPPQLQRGDFLIESLIGLVLAAIIGLGVIHVTSRVSISQKDMRMQEIAINQMRAALIRNGMGALDLCADGLEIILPNEEEVEVELHGCDDTATATIFGKDVPGIRKPIFVSAKAESFDQIMVGGTWEMVQ